MEALASPLSVWEECLRRLGDSLPQSAINQWLSPLQAEETPTSLTLWAPNQYVLDGVTDDYLALIIKLIQEIKPEENMRVMVGVGEKPLASTQEMAVLAKKAAVHDEMMARMSHPNNLNPYFSFDNFVVGKSNQLAEAAGRQVAENPGTAFNPLCVYGPPGVGKSHLIQAIGNELKARGKKVYFLSSERFVADMVKAIQSNMINEFKNFYRSLDCLLIDDIQFLAGKERSQEEFFHTFNALLEGKHQIILTSDRYPKEIHGIEERLQSRFGSGLTIAIELPELETRVAILMSKAELSHVTLPTEVAFFIAKRIRSNTRELEGVLKTVIANAQFSGAQITLAFVQECLKAVLAVQDKILSIDNILRVVADYYKIKISDLLSQKRNREIARPRQMAMALCKEFTSMSLPEIGKAFADRDHTTVLHACRTIKAMCEKNPEITEDFNHLTKLLSS